MSLGFRPGIALVAYDTSIISEMLYEGGLFSDSIVAPCSWDIHIHDSFKPLRLRAGTDPKSGLFGKGMQNTLVL